MKLNCVPVESRKSSRYREGVQILSAMFGEGATLADAAFPH